MLVELLTVIETALNDGSYGVNYQLQRIPRYASDRRPKPIKAILSPISSEVLHQGDLGSDRPLLLVSNPRAFDQQGEQMTTIIDTDVGQGVEITVAYITEVDALKSADGLKDAWYTLRAIQRSIRTLFTPAEADKRQVNGVQLRDLLQVTLYPTRGLKFEGVEDLLIGGAVVLRIGARDEEPTVS